MSEAAPPPSYDVPWSRSDRVFWELLGVCVAAALLAFCAYVAITSNGTFFGEGPSTEELHTNLWWCGIAIVGNLLCWARLLLAPVRRWTSALGCLALAPSLAGLAIAAVDSLDALPSSGPERNPIGSSGVGVCVAITASAVAAVVLPWLARSLVDRRR